jgi:hypothetical protein
MNRDALADELRRLEHEVVAAERQLADEEARLVELRRGREDAREAKAQLELMREQQRKRQQERLRLLSLLQR